MRMNPNIKSRQLRKEFNSIKLKEIGNEMCSKKHLGLKVEKEKLGVNSLTFLENFKHLQQLSIYNISKDISTISKLKNLKQIALCGLKLDSIDFLESLPNLEYLWFQGSQIKNIDSFRKLKNLKALKLFKLRKLENVDFLEDMTSLQYFNIDNCSNILKFPELNNLKKLRRVHLDTMKRLHDISQLATAKNLQDLIVVNTEALPSNCFDSFLEHKTIHKILIGNVLKNNKKYSEIIKRVPKQLQMEGFYGTENEHFKIM